MERSHLFRGKTCSSSQFVSVLNSRSFVLYIFRLNFFLLIVKELDKLWLIWHTSFKHKQFNCPHSSVSEVFSIIKLSLAICVIILKKKKLFLVAALAFAVGLVATNSQALFQKWVH